jgi:hypothetical protein
MVGRNLQDSQVLLRLFCTHHSFVACAAAFGKSAAVPSHAAYKFSPNCMPELGECWNLQPLAQACAVAARPASQVRFTAPCRIRKVLWRANIRLYNGGMV